MRRASKKTKRDFSNIQVQAPLDLPVHTPMDEHDGFRPGERVWFNTSLVAERYSWGTIREIKMQPNGNVAITVWDEERCMWRSFDSSKLHKVKPEKPKRVRRQK